MWETTLCLETEERRTPLFLGFAQARMLSSKVCACLALRVERHVSPNKSSGNRGHTFLGFCSLYPFLSGTLRFGPGSFLKGKGAASFLSWFSGYVWLVVERQAAARAATTGSGVSSATCRTVAGRAAAAGAACGRAGRAASVAAAVAAASAGCRAAATVRDAIAIGGDHARRITAGCAAASGRRTVALIRSGRTRATATIIPRRTASPTGSTTSALIPRRTRTTVARGAHVALACAAAGRRGVAVARVGQ